jgi:hypothetical protein
MDLTEMGWGDMDLIDLSQDMDQWRALVNAAMSLEVLSNVGKFLAGCATGGFSRMAQLRGINSVER